MLERAPLKQETENNSPSVKSSKFSAWGFIPASVYEAQNVSHQEPSLQKPATVTAVLPPPHYSLRKRFHTQLYKHPLRIRDLAVVTVLKVNKTLLTERELCCRENSHSTKGATTDP